MLTQCAISGCHDAASYTNCDNLLLDSWEHLFQGGADGASVIPYSPEFSPFLTFINTDSALGAVNYPSMPISTPGRSFPFLTKAQYQMFYSWIDAGAPDANGNIPFATNRDTRQKIYITQQGCDLVAVVDAESKLIMRYIPVGVPAGIVPSQSPHDVTISDDGMYGYVSLFTGTTVQKFDTRSDSLVGVCNLASLTPGNAFGGWSIIDVSPMDTTLVVSAYLPQGLIAYVNPVSMTAESSPAAGTMVNAHGIENNPTFDTFYVCSQFGNCVYKFSKNGFPATLDLINIDPSIGGVTTSSSTNTPDPHQIQMAPDYSKYFVTCQNSNEVRVMDYKTDTLMAVIPVGAFPQEMDVSSTYPYLFAVCMNDANNPNPGRVGSVYVINYNTLQVVTVWYGDFYQPHDVSVDDLLGQVFVISTNLNGTAHHVTNCGGNSGWYSVYNLHDLAPADNNRYIMTHDSYASQARF